MSENKKLCKDCIHCGLCLNIDRLTLFDKNQPAHCKAFKDKSLFVELPCRCKDCKHIRKNFVGTYYCDNEKNGAAKRHTDLNEYCSYAKLKEMGVRG